MSRAITVRVWDPLVRLLHGMLAIAFFGNYFLNEAGDDIHTWLGYAASLAILLRFVWGFVGSGAARWSDFAPSPSALLTHLRALRARTPVRRLGHTPLGALVMIAMMLLVLSLGVSGFMMAEIDYFWGEEWLETLHSRLADALLVLVILHVGAALFESWHLGENLILSMITGKRRAPP